MRMLSFKALSTKRACALLHHTGAQYSATENHRAVAETLSVLQLAPQVVPASLRIKLLRA